MAPSLRGEAGVLLPSPMGRGRGLGCICLCFSDPSGFVLKETSLFQLFQKAEQSVPRSNAPGLL